MDRIQISGNVPADRAEVMSDPVEFMDTLRDKWDAEIAAENEHAAEKNKVLWTHDAEFWKRECIDGPTYAAEYIAECLANLQAAIDGDEFARERIFRALHQIERNAIPQAKEHLLEIYEGEA